MATSSKLSQSWKHSAPSAQPSPSIKSLEDKNDDIQIIEEEEEVLVDDFDGQCCRTYPYNHSKIQRWREERRKRGEEKRAKESKEARRQEKETLQGVQGAGKEHQVSCSGIETGVRPGEPITTSAGNNHRPIRSQYSGHVICLDQSEASMNTVLLLAGVERVCL